MKPAAAMASIESSSLADVADQRLEAAVRVADVHRCFRAVFVPFDGRQVSGMSVYNRSNQPSASVGRSIAPD